MHCLQQDAGFRDIAGDVLKTVVDDTNMNIASLTSHLNLDASYSLFSDTFAMEVFFSNDTLRTDHINQLDVVFSLIGPILRYVYSVLPSSIVSHPPMKPPTSLILTQTNPNKGLLASGAIIIMITLRLIAGSSDPESACTTVRSLDTLAILVCLLPHCETMRGPINDTSLLNRPQSLVFLAHSFLCVVATPFIGVSVASNSNVASVLKTYGWTEEVSAPSIQHDF
jgi:hypothetical protein